MTIQQVQGQQVPAQNPQVAAKKVLSSTTVKTLAVVATTLAVAGAAYYAYQMYGASQPFYGPELPQCRLILDNPVGGADCEALLGDSTSTAHQGLPTVKSLIEQAYYNNVAESVVEDMAIKVKSFIVNTHSTVHNIYTFLRYAPR